MRTHTIRRLDLLKTETSLKFAQFHAKDKKQAMCFLKNLLVFLKNLLIFTKTEQFYQLVMQKLFSGVKTIN